MTTKSVDPHAYQSTCKNERDIHMCPCKVEGCDLPENEHPKDE